MRWSDYAELVTATDTSVGRPDQQRRDIAIYGVAAEIGSLLSTVKRAIIAANSVRGLIGARRRLGISEEIGDVLWYVVALSQLSQPRISGRNIFQDDIRNLHAEISASDPRAVRIEGVLTPEIKLAFLKRAEAFVGEEDFGLDAYQELAFLTARSKGDLLERVCLAVLSQLGTEVLRQTLPPVELELNRKVADRDIAVVLGEIVWHLSAVATLSGLSLGDIAAVNAAKVTGRYRRTTPTPLPDEDYPPHERFPRKLDVGFVSVGRGRSQMYLHGRRLGDNLTDNAAEDDGYRFHDVMHLAFLAKLGWSPVLRKLMGRKRKSSPQTDEVQDGARAQIVEELIIKSIHSEITVDLDAAWPDAASPTTGGTEIVPFRFLSQLSRLASGLEVAGHQPWEWEEAVLEGSRLFQALRRNGSGTVRLDLDARSIAFDPDVYVDLPGTVVGMGSAMSSKPVLEKAEREGMLARAALLALGLDSTDLDVLSVQDIRELPGGGVAVRARGPVQTAMWDRRAVSFRASWAGLGELSLCTVLALADAHAPSGS